MAVLQVNPECSPVVRRVRHLIKEHMGESAATVFSEAMANVREHGSLGPAHLVLHRSHFEVKNVSPQAFCPETNKPQGEGGYGLHIMECMGASLDAKDHYCCVRWRRPEL